MEKIPTNKPENLKPSQDQAKESVHKETIDMYHNPDLVAIFESARFNPKHYQALTDKMI